MSRSHDRTPTSRGRLLAVLYLLVIVCGIIAQALIADRLVVPTDAARTAANIIAQRTLYRLAFSIFIVEMAAQMAVTALSYELLKPVDVTIARISTVMGLIGAGIKMFARVFYYAPLILLSGAAWLASLEPAQLATLALVSIKINSQGAGIALAFFGFETVLRGWLIYRSNFLPRFLGVLSIISGLGWLAWVYPPLGSATFMIVAPFALLGVILFTGWLLVRGVDDESWYARAELAAASVWR